MEKCIETFKKQVNKLGINFTSCDFFNEILIKYHGKPTFLQNLARVTKEDSRTFKIHIFDSSLRKDIEKAIISSNLGFNLNSTGTDIYVLVPLITEERRTNLLKLVRYEAEQIRISIRNIRRSINEKSRNLEKKKEISKDENLLFQKEIQKITNEFINKIDSILKEKEVELFQF